MSTEKTEELNFGLRVEQLLLQRKIKPRDFYDAVDINTQLFYDWKKGSMPNARTAIKVAKFFGVPVEWLVNGETVKNPLQPKVEELQEKLTQLRDFVNDITKGI